MGDEKLFIQTSKKVFNLILEVASEICHNYTNKPVDGAYLADFGIDVKQTHYYSMNAPL